MPDEILFSWLGLALVMALLWARQLRTKNATSVDAAWAAGIGGVVCVYGLLGEGDPGRRALVAVISAVWAFRLAWHLVKYRVLGEDEEDGRYASMREAWGDEAPLWFFVFYQGQAAVAILFTVPQWQAMRGGPLDLWCWAGAAVWVVSLQGEAIADEQLARFKADPTSKGRTCRRGLWRYSRHPNYFFECVHWWAYVLIARGAWLTWLGPVAMLLFLFRLTGIPYTEKQALKSRGDDYRRYQKETSAFFPWFQKDVTS